MARPVGCSTEGYGVVLYSPLFHCPSVPPLAWPSQKPGLVRPVGCSTEGYGGVLYSMLLRCLSVPPLAWPSRRPGLA